MGKKTDIKNLLNLKKAIETQEDPVIGDYINGVKEYGEILKNPNISIRERIFQSGRYIEMVKPMLLSNIYFWIKEENNEDLHYLLEKGIEKLEEIRLNTDLFFLKSYENPLTHEQPQKVTDEVENLITLAKNFSKITDKYILEKEKENTK